MKDLILLWQRVNDVRWVISGLATAARGFETFGCLS